MIQTAWESHQIKEVDLWIETVSNKLVPLFERQVPQSWIQAERI
jgi:hypothetical protein